MTTTAHSALAEILRALEVANQRKCVTSRDDLEGVSENALVEVPYRRLVRMHPDDPSAASDTRGLLARLMFAQDESRPARRFVALLDVSDSDWSPVIAGHGEHLRVAAADFRSLRHATVLGQAEIARSGEHVEVKEEGEVGSASIIDAATSEGTTGLLVQPLCIYK